MISIFCSVSEVSQRPESLGGAYIIFNPFGPYCTTSSQHLTFLFISLVSTDVGIPVRNKQGLESTNFSRRSAIHCRYYKDLFRMENTEEITISVGGLCVKEVHTVCQRKPVKFSRSS
jgi:hypothetical protein